MSENLTPNQAWLSEHAPHFDALNSHLDAITEQNTTHEELIVSELVHTPELKRILSLELSQEQIEDFKGVQATDRELEGTFPEILDRWDAVETELADLALKKTMLTYRDEDLRKQQELIVARRPRLAEQIGEVVAKLEEKGREEYTAELDERELELLADAEAFEKASAAWVIPKVINPGDFIDNPEGEITDSFPDEKLPQDIEEIAERARRRFIEKTLAGASEYLAVFLAVEPGTIYTTEQLGSVLYNGDARSVKQRTSCVAALISNHELSKNNIIQSALVAEGLILQRGKRQIRDTSGKVVKHRVPIFRAIDPNAPNLSETITRTADGTIFNDTGWRDERAHKLQEAQMPEDLVPTGPIEKQIINNLSSGFRQDFVERGWLDEGAVTVKDAAGFFNQSGVYPTERSLTNSAAWKAVIAKKPQEVDMVSLTDVMMIALYPEVMNSMRQNRNLQPRLRALIAEKLKSWQEAEQEAKAA